MTEHVLKVTKSTVTKLFIEGAENLDPITVFLEDFEPKNGKITVSCYGKSWTAHWGSMWDGLTVGQFFAELNAQYIIGYFAPGLSGSRFSSTALANKARRTIIERRKRYDLTKDDARQFYDAAQSLGEAESIEGIWHSEIRNSLMTTLFGEEWWFDLDDATEPNHDYQYLCRIIKAVQHALDTTPSAQEGQAEQYGSYVTTPGESVAGIALRQLGDESRWEEISDLNAHAFPDMGPHDYYPVGTELVMPKAAQPAKACKAGEA